MFPDSVRPGRSLVEIIVVLAIWAVVAGAVAGTLVTSSSLGRVAADRAELLGDRRLASNLLAHELRPIALGQDGVEIGTDTIALRAFRALATVCRADSAKAELRLRGLRLPEPQKDSVLVLAGAGVERALAFSGAYRIAPGPSCMVRPGEAAVELHPGAGLVAGDVLLFFERGSYHLSGSALRYRRGRSGRQPLTAASFDDDSTDLAVETRARSASAGVDTVAVLLRLSSAPATAYSSAISPVVVRIPMLNSAVPLDSIKPPS